MTINAIGHLARFEVAFIFWSKQIESIANRKNQKQPRKVGRVLLYQQEHRLSVAESLPWTLWLTSSTTCATIELSLILWYFIFLQKECWVLKCKCACTNYITPCSSDKPHQSLNSNITISMCFPMYHVIGFLHIMFLTLTIANNQTK